MATDDTHQREENQRTSNTYAVTRPASGWKLLFLRAAGFGAGFALAGALIIALTVSWINRPKPWSERAIFAKPGELTLQQVDKEIRFTFRYALTNNTDAEYALPGTETGALMRKLPNYGSFAKIDGTTWDTTIRIPPKQTVDVGFVVPYQLSTYDITATKMLPDDQLVDFAGKRLKEIDGFVFFDYASKYRIEMTKSWTGKSKK